MQRNARNRRGGFTTRIHGHQKVEIRHYKALDILKDSHIEKEKSS